MSSVSLAQLSDTIAHIRLDDGKRNVLTLAIVRELNEALSSLVENTEVRAIIFEGNESALTVGLDTETVLAGGANGQSLLSEMRQVLVTLYTSRLASVAISQGHATAAGAMLLLVSDCRIGAGEGGKIGLSEVSVGLEVPLLTQQLVRDRINASYHHRATSLATLFDYKTAAHIGYLDEVASTRELALERAMDQANAFARLDETAYVKTKLSLRSAFFDLLSTS